MDLLKKEEIKDLKNENIEYWREIRKLESHINIIKNIINKNNTKIVDLCDHCFEIEIQKNERTFTFVKFVVIHINKSLFTHHSSAKILRHGCTRRRPSC